MTTVICNNWRCTRVRTPDTAYWHNFKSYCCKECFLEAVTPVILANIYKYKGNLEKILEEVNK